MKKIILIGDSIRMGYDKYVKEAFVGAAEVFYPDDNCRFAEYVLRYAHEWRDGNGWGEDADAVHWNAGLWDVLELFGDEPLTPIACYKELIARIDKRLRTLFPKAKIVFATSTSVNTEKSSPIFTRHNEIIEAYNAAAIEALKGTDTVINDLYSLTKELPEACHSDWVHFNTAKGREVIGGRVVAVLSDILDISPNAINIDNFVPEQYTAQNIGF